MQKSSKFLVSFLFLYQIQTVLISCCLSITIYRFKNLYFLHQEHLKICSLSIYALFIKNCRFSGSLKVFRILGLVLLVAKFQLFIKRIDLLAFNGCCYATRRQWNIFCSFITTPSLLNHVSHKTSSPLFSLITLQRPQTRGAWSLLDPPPANLRQPRGLRQPPKRKRSARAALSPLFP